MPLDINSLSQDDIKQLLSQLSPQQLSGIVGNTGGAATSGGQKAPPVGDVGVQPGGPAQTALSDIVGGQDNTLNTLGISGGGGAAGGGKAGGVTAPVPLSQMASNAGGQPVPPRDTLLPTSPTATPDTLLPTSTPTPTPAATGDPTTNVPGFPGTKALEITPAGGGPPLLLPEFANWQQVIGNPFDQGPQADAQASMAWQGPIFKAINDAEQSQLTPSLNPDTSGGAGASGAGPIGQSLDWSNPAVLSAARQSFDQQIGRPSTEQEWGVMLQDMNLENQWAQGEHGRIPSPTDIGNIIGPGVIALAGAAFGGAGALAGAETAAAEGGAIAAEEGAAGGAALGEAATSFAGAAPAATGGGALGSALGGAVGSEAASGALIAPETGTLGTAIGGAAASDAGVGAGAEFPSGLGAATGAGSTDLATSLGTPLSDVTAVGDPTITGENPFGSGVQTAPNTFENPSFIGGDFSTATPGADPTFVNSGGGFGGGTTTPTSNGPFEIGGGAQGDLSNVPTDASQTGDIPGPTNLLSEDLGVPQQTSEGLDQAMSGDVPGKSWWQTGREILSDPYLRLGTNIAGLGVQLLNQPSTGTTAKANTTALNTQANALNASASNLNTSGQALTSFLTTGRLPAGAESTVDSAIQAAKAATRSQFASMGMSGSTEEQKSLQAVDANAVNQRFQIATAMAQTGLSEISQANQQSQLAAQIYQNLLNQSLQSDQQLSTAISNFVAALGGTSTRTVTTTTG